MQLVGPSHPVGCSVPTGVVGLYRFHEDSLCLLQLDERLGSVEFVCG